MFKKNLCLACLFTLLSVVTVDGGADQTVEKKIESIVRQLIRDIQSHNYEGILKLVPDHGLSDADSRIAKKTIRAEIRNKQSGLYKRLYEDVTATDMNICKESGSMLVSPHAFYEK